MKRLIGIIAAAVLLLTLSGCKKTKEDLKFYVVPGEAVTASMGNDAILATAKAKGRVAFTGKDIAGWLWEDHRVQLQNVAVKGGKGEGGSPLFQAEAQDCFVLTVGNRLIYAGGFAPAESAVKAGRSPYIQDGQNNTFYLLCDRKEANGKDPRANEYLYAFLTEQQLLVSTINTVE